MTNTTITKADIFAAYAKSMTERYTNRVELDPKGIEQGLYVARVMMEATKFNEANFSDEKMQEIMAVALDSGINFDTHTVKDTVVDGVTQPNTEEAITAWETAFRAHIKRYPEHLLMFQVQAYVGHIVAEVSAEYKYYTV